MRVRRAHLTFAEIAGGPPYHASEWQTAEEVDQFSQSTGINALRRPSWGRQFSTTASWNHLSQNRIRSLVAASTRLSFTRGAGTSTEPAVVVTVRLVGRLRAEGGGRGEMPECAGVGAAVTGPAAVATSHVDGEDAARLEGSAVLAGGRRPRADPAESGGQPSAQRNRRLACAPDACTAGDLLGVDRVRSRHGQQFGRAHEARVHPRHRSAKGTRPLAVMHGPQAKKVPPEPLPCSMTSMRRIPRVWP